MDKNENKKQNLKTDEDMLKKILLRECGDCETDEYAADVLELNNYLQNCEAGEDNPPIGESVEFSTCKYTMIPRGDDDDTTVNCQGS